MNTAEYGKIVAKNLKRLAYESHKTQTEIAQDLGINKSTLSGWMNGARTPKMSKIDMLCEYFGCSRSDIMEPQDAPRNTNRVTNDQAELIRLTMKAKPENVSIALSILRKLEGIE